MKKIYLNLTLIIVWAFTQQAFAQVAFDWVKGFGSTQSDIGKSIATDRWGNVLVTGFFEEEIEFTKANGDKVKITSTGREDILIVKYDIEGNFLWARSMGGNDIEQNLSGDQGMGIAVDDSGNVFTTGHFTGIANFNSGIGNPVTVTANGAWDVFITKHDSSGNLKWVKTFGGEWYDVAYGIEADDNFVYITGKVSGPVDFDPGTGTAIIPNISDGAFIAKYTKNGDYVWAKMVGTEELNTATGYSIKSDSLGNVYSAGTFRRTVDFDPGAGSFPLTTNSSLGLSDVYILKLDADGNFKWARSVGGEETDMCGSLALDPWGNAYVTGRFARTVDFNTDLGDLDILYLTSKRNVGLNIDFFPDAFLVKINAEGKFQWAKRMGGETYDEGFGVNTDQRGNVYITGYFSGLADFDDSTLEAVYSPWDADVYIAKLDSAGNYKWLKSIEGPGADHGNAIATYRGHILTTGRFEATPDFDPDANNSHTLTSVGSQDWFIHKLSCNDTITVFVDTISCGDFVYNGEVIKEDGQYQFLMVGESGCDSTVSINLTIETIEATISVNEKVLSTGEFSTYQWLKEGVVLEGETKQQLEVSENGNYQVIVSSEKGCIDTSEVYIVNNATSINETQVAAVKIYPNPTHDQIQIVSQLGEIQVVINSIDGRKVMEYKGENKTISLKHLDAGAYQIILSKPDGEMIMADKIIKL